MCNWAITEWQKFCVKLEMTPTTPLSQHSRKMSKFSMEAKSKQEENEKRLTSVHAHV